MSPDAPPVVALDGVVKRFGERVAVDGLAFAVAPGEIFGLVGPDGAGKTTTLRMLAGLLPPDAGTIRVADTDVVAAPEAVKARISYMPQRFGLYEELTVAENIRFYADLFEVPRRVREERTDRLLAASGMTAFRAFRAGKLSGGMKQKLGLTCALVHTPDIVLLDEPTTGVDPVSRREFWAILYRLRAEGVTILLSTAYLDEAERCDRLALLSAGRVLHCDTPAALKARMPGAVLAIMTGSGRAARAALDGQEGVGRALLVGGGLHVVVDDPARRIPQIRASLAERSVPVGDIAAIAPGVEDVFMALVADASPR
ncbi:ABC transporter ATP-binding protein [Acuticoccus sp. M5D2P5]|uniref:ABC transporter ATP-binding protein n=1 Tax=Acuticoccus kalidii TaxID=2910977 RepID=UPI001F2EED88|nr:ABC transporter ATP-binding protein [Acuticoccus kalidii]MCF3933743.1 ABC transporter ATP-binding protein [Acuticoccus kalidii]